MERTVLAQETPGGWKFYGFCLPQTIGDELLDLKRQRMEDYRKSQIPEVE